MERRSLLSIEPSSFLRQARATVALLVHWRSRKRNVGWWYGLFFVCLTLVNLWVQMFSTTACLPCSPGLPYLPGILNFLKVNFLYLFLADFVLRVWSAPERSEYRGKSWPSVRYLCRRWTVIDLLSVAPLFIPGMPTYFSIFRVARLARIFTLFSSRRLLQGREHIRRAIISSQGVIITVGVLLSLLIFAMGVGMYLVESQAQPDKFTSIPVGLWWALVTITTVGYGDLVPVTELGRVLTQAFLILGLFMAITPAAKLAASFVGIVEQEETHRLWLMRLRSLSRAPPADIHPYHHPVAMSLRARTWQILGLKPQGDTLTLAIDIALTVIVLLATMGFVLGTIPSLSNLESTWHFLENTSLIVFPLHYVMKLWACQVDRRYRGLLGVLRFAITPYGIVDLIVITPSVLYLFGISSLPAQLLVIVRFVRLLRYGEIEDNLAVVLQALSRAAAALSIITYYFFSLTCMLAVLLFHFESGAQPEQFGSIPHSFYASVVTITTVGYGDLRPITVFGRIAVIIALVLGYGLSALLVGTVGSQFLELSKEKSITNEVEARGTETSLDD